MHSAEGKLPEDERQAVSIQNSGIRAWGLTVPGFILLFTVRYGEDGTGEAYSRKQLFP